MPEPVKKRIRRIEELGWQVERSDHHLRCTHPDAAYPVFAAATSNSSTGWLNLIAELRRSLRAGKMGNAE